jgi:hypothetical protein
LLQAYGPAWWALLALAGAGLLGALVAGRTRVERMLGAVAAISAVAFLFTPQGLGTDANPLFFKFNLRYPTPALVLGLGLLPLLPWFARRDLRWVPLALSAALLAVTQLDPTIWPTGLREQRFAASPGSATSLGALAIGAGLLLVVAGAAALRWRSVGERPAGTGGRAALGAVAAAAIVLVPSGWLVQRHYLRERYRDFEPLKAVSTWARDVQDSRIGIVGFFLQYPLYGLDLSNRVDYVARHGPHGAFTRIRSCREWRRALNEGRYRYVVTTPFDYPGNVLQQQPAEARWTGSDPSVNRVLRERGVVSLFRLDGRLDPGGCDRAASSRQPARGGPQTTVR